MLAGLSFIFAGADVRADDPSALRHQVESLISSLDAPTLAERSRAERDLLDVGPAALPFLPAPELTRSQATRESVKRIRLQLERRAARESALASHITLEGKHTVAEILRELTRQTRNRVELDPDTPRLAEQTLPVAWNQQPFWDAIDELQAALKLNAVLEPGQSRVLLVANPPSPADLAVLNRGPFRLTIRSAQVRPIIGQPDRLLVRLNGFVSVEPRIRPLFVHFAAAEVMATGLEPWNSAASYELPVADAGRQAPLQFDFVMPADKGQKPSQIRLNGRIFVQLAASTERIVFDHTALESGTIRRRGGVSVRLRDVEFEGPPEGPQRAAIQVLVGYDTGGPAFESHRTWMFHNAAYLEVRGTAAARRIDFTDYDTSLQSQGAIGVDYRWERLDPPYTQYQFVYEAPTLILDQPLEFTVESLRLPAARAEPGSP